MSTILLIQDDDRSARKFADGVLSDEEFIHLSDHMYKSSIVPTDSLPEEEADRLVTSLNDLHDLWHAHGGYERTNRLLQDYLSIKKPLDR